MGIGEDLSGQIVEFSTAPYIIEISAPNDKKLFHLYNESRMMLYIDRAHFIAMLCKSCESLEDPWNPC